MEIYNMFLGNGTGNLKAFVKLKTSEGLIIDGFRVIESRNGPFVGWPQKEVTKNNQKEYFPVVFTGEEREESPIKDGINELIMNHYVATMEGRGVKVQVNDKKNDWIAKGAQVTRGKSDEEANILVDDDEWV